MPPERGDRDVQLLADPVRRLTPIVLCWALAPLACDLPPRDEGPDPDLLALDRLYTAGGAGEGFGEVTYFAVGPGGETAVLDRYNHVVRVFDRDGRPLSTLGGEGQGPGEIDGGGPLAVTADGRVVLADAGRGALSVWETEGRFLGSAPWPGRVTAAAARGRLVYLKVAGRGGALYDGSFSIVPFDPSSLEALDPVLEVPAGVGAHGLTLGCLSCAFSPTPDGTFALKPAERDYRVARVAPDGSVEHVWNRPDRGTVAFTGEEWIEWRRRRAERGDMLVRSMGLPVPPRTFTEEDLPPPGDKPPLESAGSLGVDGSGRLWTLPAVPHGEPDELDRFAPGGPLLGTVRVPEDLHAVSVAGNHLAGLAFDQVGRPLVHVYRIVERRP